MSVLPFVPFVAFVLSPDLHPFTRTGGGVSVGSRHFVIPTTDFSPFLYFAVSSGPLPTRDGLKFLYLYLYLEILP